MRTLCIVFLLLLIAIGPLAAEVTNFAVVDTIKAKDGPWDFASVDAGLHRLYVARGDGVLMVDLRDDRVTPTLVPGSRVHGVLPLPNGLVISTNGDTDTATLFTAAGGHVVADLPTGKKPDAVVRDGKTGLVAVMNGGDGTVTLIDPANRTVAGSLTIGGALEFAVADGQGRVFVNVEDKNEIAVLDIPARRIANRYPLPGCQAPSGLALDDTSHVLLAACANGVAVALSATDGTLLATLPIGKGPDAVMFDERTKRFLVPCGRDGVMTVITESTSGALTVTATEPTARGARTGARDPVTGRIYLPPADFLPAKAHERPVTKPNSFRILVLSPG